MAGACWVYCGGGNLNLEEKEREIKHGLRLEYCVGFGIYLDDKILKI
jgi:Pyruvate/2-oxoacid:ferredoxin oxidoreductase delta subunit